MNLTEAQLRVLARIARLMVGRSSCDILVQLRDGGVRDYNESTKLPPAEMDSPDEALADVLQRLARVSPAA